MSNKITKIVNEARWTDGQIVNNRLNEITYDPMRSQEEFVPDLSGRMPRLNMVSKKISPE